MELQDIYLADRAGLAWAEALADVEGAPEIADFLATGFFKTAADAWEISSKRLADPEAIVPRLYRAWQVVHSTGGNAPIAETAFVAGIQALLEDGVSIEPAVAREAIIAYQKANPYQIRFTVNRMGDLAHARFLEQPTRE